MSVPAHSDDWFGPETETGILGHGHDGLVIDRIKHSEAAGVSGRQLAIIVSATIWALEQRIGELSPSYSHPLIDWLEEQVPPEALRH